MYPHERDLRSHGAKELWQLRASADGSRLFSVNSLSFAERRKLFLRDDDAEILKMLSKLFGHPAVVVLFFLPRLQAVFSCLCT